MKVVTAATHEQECFIEELVNYMYTEIFPHYFSDEYIKELRGISVLIPDQPDLYNGTLKEAFQLISGMQAIIAVIESISTTDDIENHREIFEKNANIIEEYGYKFPLTIDQFINLKEDCISLFSKPTSQYLM